MGDTVNPGELGAQLRDLAQRIELAHPVGDPQASTWAISLRRLSYQIETLRADPPLLTPEAST